MDCRIRADGKERNRFEFKAKEGEPRLIKTRSARWKKRMLICPSRDSLEKEARVKRKQMPATSFAEKRNFPFSLVSKAHIYHKFPPPTNKSGTEKFILTIVLYLITLASLRVCVCMFENVLPRDNSFSFFAETKNSKRMTNTRSKRATTINRRRR
jgi:hypothetical protein